jgi:hypothetical protein
VSTVEGGSAYGIVQLLCGKYMACIEWNWKCPILVNAGYMNGEITLADVLRKENQIPTDYRQI